MPENQFHQQLKEFIAIPTIANDRASNEAGITYVSKILSSAEFDIKIEGDSPYHQPVIIATHHNPNTTSRVVLYGHYDVEKIKTWEKWDTPPFELTEKEGRYYCRGIADNKGILLTRMLAIQEMVASQEELPNILWIIQGEEEIEGQTPFEVIPKHIDSFGARLYVEETGMTKEGKPIIFHLPKTSSLPPFLYDLNETLFEGDASFENRSLRKFSACPFLTNIPPQGYYIGFGPNDPLCRIHADNESLNIDSLQTHKGYFKQFLRWVHKTSIF